MIPQTSIVGFCAAVSHQAARSARGQRHGAALCGIGTGPNALVRCTITSRSTTGLGGARFSSRLMDSRASVGVRWHVAWHGESCRERSGKVSLQRTSRLLGSIELAHTQDVQVFAQIGEIFEHQRTDLFQHVAVRLVCLPPHQHHDILGQATP
jgi:hypothetical protein